MRVPHKLKHHALRTINWLLYVWLVIYTGSLAVSAQMNPGIAYGLISTSIMMAAAYNWIVFGERITLKMCVGMVIVIVSVMWLSLISG